MHSEDRNVVRREQELNGALSIVGCVQMFRDMSQVSLAAGVLKFYFLPNTVFNFTEDF